MNRFNLIDEPWIPVIGRDLISLRELFTMPDVAELAANPIQKIALLKLLLAIAQAACTPKNDADWEKLGVQGLSEKCLHYLEKWHDVFWLYGKRPFLQMPAISSAEKSPLGAFLPEIATGNTTLLTQIQQEKPLSDAEKALLIVTLMGFSLGGKQPDLKVSLSPDVVKKKSAKAGPCLGHLGYLHAFFSGNNICTTIWLNLLTEDFVKQLRYYPGNIGIPPWEVMPETEDCEVAESLKKTLMGRLIPVTRFCLLAEDGIHIHCSEGITHPSLIEGGIDPFFITTGVAKDKKALWTDPDKRPWRSLTSMLSFISQETPGLWDCVQLRQGWGRLRNVAETVVIWSGGLRITNIAPGEQKVTGTNDFVESTIELSTSWLGEDWFIRLKVEMKALEDLSQLLKRAITNYFESQKVKNKTNTPINLFWQLCENRFSELVKFCAETDATLREKLRKTFAGFALQIYNDTCPKNTPRQLDAWAQFRPNFGKYLKPLENPHE